MSLPRNGAVPRASRALCEAFALELGRQCVEAELGLSVPRCRRLTPDDVPALEPAVVAALDAVGSDVFTSAVLA